VSAAGALPRTPSAAPASPWSGLLAVDKPAGMTSHDVVEVARRRLRATGAGHLGTLDPGATGLLLLALGAATRCVPVWQGGEKTYEAALRFGVVTSTQDLDGEVLERRPVDLDEARVRAASPAFVGDLEQVPPMVSALQVGGERLHRIARRGGTVERSPRAVRVSEWSWISFDLPLARFRVRCSGGTYVRTLAHDLGASLGCGAALEALRRLRSEPFGLERSVALRDLDRMSSDEVLATAGIPIDEALSVLPAIRLDEAAIARVGHGQRPSIEVREGVPLVAGPRSIVARDPGGRALALGELVADPASPGRALFCPRVVFPWAVRQGHG
jgi:tRNA pseudouridine55 synthase